MKKSICFFLTAAVFVFVSALFYLNSNRNREQLDIEKLKTSPPILSGPTSDLPWLNDENFINAQVDNGTKVLLASYKTVLPDPLPGEEYNVHLGARLLAGKVVKSGEIFSQNNTIGPYVESKGYRKGPTYAGTKLTTTIGGGVCKIASTLYNVTVLSNLNVVERHNHSMPVPYVPYGQDATVSYGSYDFKFKNDTPYPVMIWAQGVENSLYIGFYGREKPPKVEWHHETLKVQKSGTIYKINTSLPPGTKKTILEGMDGASIKSWVTIEKPDGTIETKNLGISNYRPMESVVEIGE